MEIQKSRAKAFFRGSEGASAMEYCLLITGIAIGLLTAIYAIGAKLNLLISPLNG